MLTRDDLIYVLNSKRIPNVINFSLRVNLDTVMVCGELTYITSDKKIATISIVVEKLQYLEKKSKIIVYCRES